MADLANLSQHFSPEEMVNYEEFATYVGVDPAKVASLTNNQLIGLFDMWIHDQNLAQSNWRAKLDVLQRNTDFRYSRRQARPAERVALDATKARFTPQAVAEGTAAASNDQLLTDMMAFLGLGAAAAAAIAFRPNPYTYEGLAIEDEGGRRTDFNIRTILALLEASMPKQTKVQNLRAPVNQAMFEVHKYFEGTGWIKVVDVTMIQTGGSIEVKLEDLDIEDQAEVRAAQGKETVKSIFDVVEDIRSDNVDWTALGAQVLQSGGDVLNRGIDFAKGVVSKMAKPFKGFKFSHELWAAFDKVCDPFVKAHEAKALADADAKRRADDEHYRVMALLKCEWCSATFTGQEEKCVGCDQPASPESVEHRRKVNWSQNQEPKEAVTA